MAGDFSIVTKYASLRKSNRPQFGTDVPSHDGHRKRNLLPIYLGQNILTVPWCQIKTCAHQHCESMFGFGKYKSVTCNDVESSMNMQVILLPLLCLLFCGFLCFKAYQKYTNKDDASTEEETKALKTDDGAAGDSTEKSE